jgi:hypothetical protein
MSLSAAADDDDDDDDDDATLKICKTLLKFTS